MTRHVVATILPGRTLDAALAAMRGMGKCYPEHTLSLTNDPATGGMVIIYDPDATPSTAKGRGRRRTAEPSGAAGEIALGKDEPGDLVAYAFRRSVHYRHTGRFVRAHRRAPRGEAMKRALRLTAVLALWPVVHIADRLRRVDPPARLRTGLRWALRTAEHRHTEEGHDR